ncbi:hypothetical protein A7U60_g4397 [Sanghuangporus baumii]|uniref:F-box domain-containing protein n=1 Tax=Sanghuangporus baumii TaxID=108892 RepID=A0A9Q5NCE6_SANBA|nr:hypothetical protein A7U60_g4397 [Sanghuangporus baumii]
MEVPVLPSPLCLASAIVPLPAPDVVGKVGKDASPRLPTELWREIFVHATRVVGGYDTSYESPFEKSEISNGYAYFLRQLKENHRTKQALCLVSKTWRALAFDLIFEYLFLQEAYDWSKLAEALEESKLKQRGRGGHGMGWYCKRIEIYTHSWTQELGVAAARVVRCCPNLRVLAVGALEETGGVPVELIQAVFESCPGAIRSLDWTCDIGADQTTEMFCLISKAAKLQSLFLCVQQDLDASHAEKIDAIGSLTLPELHTIELVSPEFDPSDVLLVMAAWKLPGLRQLVLCGQTDLSFAHCFFEAHGPSLSTLEFDYAGESDPEPAFQSVLPQRGPEMLFAHCPNLTELILQAHWASSQALPGHPKIERIGLRGLHLHAGSQTRNRGGGLALRPEHDAEQRAILQALRAAFPILVDRARFPSIKSVRLLDFDQSRFRSIPWRASRVAHWAFWVKRFERLGIRLEDHAGDLIEVIFREVNVLLPEDEEPYVLQS